MKIQKGVVLGLVGALLVGAVQAVAESRMDALRPAGDDAVTVPVGAVGDRVAFARFERTGGGAWTHVSDHTYKMTGTGKQLDRTGLAHEVLFVGTHTSWESNGGLFGKEKSQQSLSNDFQAIDLATRDIVGLRSHFRWSDQSLFEVGRNTNGTQSEYGPTAASSILFGPSEFFGPQDYAKNPLFAWQGRTFRVGDPLDGLAKELLVPEAVSIKWDVGGVDLVDVQAQARAAEMGLIDNERVIAIAVDGCLRIQVGDPRPWRASFSTPTPQVTFLGFGTPVPSRVCFEVKTWVSDANPFPRLIEVRAVVNGTTVHESRTGRAAFQAGSGPIPWDHSKRADPYREADPNLERSPAGQIVPADGTGTKLWFPLSAARLAVEQDPTLLRFTTWRLQHPSARLIGASMVPIGPDGDGRRWSLTYGQPDGPAYVVETERRSPIGPTVQSEAGEFRVEPFSPPSKTPITFAAAEKLWAASFDAPGNAVVPNAVGWGFTYHPDILRCPTVQECSTWKAGFYSGTTPQSMSLFYTSDDTKRTASVGTERVSDYGLYLEAGEGILYLNRDVHHQIRVEPLAVAAEYQAERPRGLAESSVPSVNLQHAAAASASFLVLFLLAYFFPLLKWAGGSLTVALPGYAKIHKSDVLNNKVRETLVQAIRADPGITPPQLQEMTGAGWSTVVYHLGVLEKNKFVSSLIDGRHKRFFPIDDVNWSDRGRIAILKNQQSRALYELILQEPGVGPSDLSHRVGVSRSTIYWHVERLEKAGLVGRDRQRLKTVFFANPAPAALYDPKDAMEVA